MSGSSAVLLVVVGRSSTAKLATLTGKHFGHQRSSALPRESRIHEAEGVVLQQLWSGMPFERRLRLQPQRPCPYVVSALF